MVSGKSGGRRGRSTAIVISVAVACALLVALVGGSVATATTAKTRVIPNAEITLPQDQWPNDPGFAGCENRDPGDNCGGDDDWFLYGKLTGDTCRAPGSNVADQPHPDGGLPCWARGAKDPQHSAGINAMGAWAQGNTGRNDILIAYIEGGVNYSSDGIKDALDNVFLNAGELPYPQDTSGHDKGKYDYDGNGRFDIRDYVDDPRVNPDCPQGDAPFKAFDEGTTRSCIAGGQHTYLNAVNIGGAKTKYLSPEDLIVVFGHCTITGHRTAGCPAGARIDNDHNGYPNDVSGWNTYRNNNDPQTEDLGYGHPSGGFRNTVSEANNHYGSVGNCRDCRIFPIKQGAECLGLSNKWAQAILYAANIGAKVISSVVVSYQYSSYGRAAIEYANKKGVLLSLDSNDFDSTDHTDGMMYPHAIPGNAVTTDLKEDQNTKWFRARSNITSYGPHNVFSGEEKTTSGATPFMAGLLGMVQSAAENERDAGHIPRAYTPNEVRQVIMNTASPVTPQTQAPGVAKQWPGNPDSKTDATHTNWSTQYGYGRVDLGAATALVKTDRVPPSTEFTSPDWYEYIDPAKQKTLDVKGYIHASAWQSQGVSWVAEWATGGNPKDTAFKTFASGTGSRDGTIGTLDMTALKAYAAKAAGNTNTPDGPENYTVTLRIRAVDGGLKGEDRRTFTVRTDPQLVRAPLHLGGEPAAGTSYVDLEGRNEQDLVVGTADGDVRALRPDGSSVPGYPVHTRLLTEVDATNPENGNAASYKADAGLKNAHDPVSGTAVGDIDGDGQLDVVATTDSGSVYAWDPAGRLLKGFPVNQDPANYKTDEQVPTPRTGHDGSRNPARGNWSPPVLADLNGDGKLEILESTFDGHVYAWRADGTTLPGWPVDIKPTAAALAKAGASESNIIHDPKLMFAPAVGDVLGTGRPQVFVSGFDCSDDKNTVYVYGIQPDGNNHAGGAYLPGWPTGLKSVAGCYDQSIDFVEEGSVPPVIMPVEGTPHVVVTPTGAGPHVLNKDGTVLRKMSIGCTGSKCAGTPPYMGPDGLLVGITGQGGAGDLLGTTGVPNYVQSVAGAPSTLNAVGSAPVGQATLGQSYEQAWDTTTGTGVPGFLGKQDGFSFFTAPLVVGLGSGTQRAAVEGNDSNWIHAYQPDGTEAPGFPKNLGQWPSFSGVAGDARQNGKVRMAYGTREGYLFQWDVGGKAAANDQWWHYRHDERNTGQFGLDTRRPAVVAGVKVKRGKSQKVTLTWKAVGDDAVSGRAKAIDVRTSSKPITLRSFAKAKKLKAPKPKSAGATQTIALTVKKTTYVVIRSRDEAGNVSALKVIKLKPVKKKH